jgi:hypothetical protein
MQATRRKPLEPPAWLDLETSTRTRLCTWGEQLADLRARVVAPVPDTEGAFESLRHPLSDHFLALNPRSGAADRSVAEAAAAADVDRREFESSLGDAVRFEALLQKLNARVVDGHRGFRLNEAGLRPDRRGTAVLFPAPEQVPIQLDRLRHALSLTLPANAPWAAILALAMLTNAHPFADGNGRVSRMIFNLCLRAGAARELPYIPLYELFYRSRGGYEIRLRDAELNSNWDGFCNFMSDVISVVSGSSDRARPRRPGSDACKQAW